MPPAKSLQNRLRKLCGRKPAKPKTAAQLAADAAAAQLAKEIRALVRAELRAANPAKAAARDAAKAEFAKECMDDLRAKSIRLTDQINELRALDVQMEEMQTIMNEASAK